MAGNPMTREGLERLKERLHHLRSRERPENIADIEEARKHGDLSENAEYHYAKHKQGLIEAQIRELEDKIATASVIDTSRLDGSHVSFGSTVTLTDCGSGETKVYRIVGDDESDVARGWISYRSPLAASMIGKETLETFTLDTGRGVREYEISDIRFE